MRAWLLHFFTSRSQFYAADARFVCLHNHNFPHNASSAAKAAPTAASWYRIAGYPGCGVTLCPAPKIVYLRSYGESQTPHQTALRPSSAQHSNVSRRLRMDKAVPATFPLNLYARLGEPRTSCCRASFAERGRSHRPPHWCRPFRRKPTIGDSTHRYGE